MTVNSAISGALTPVYANAGTLTLAAANTCQGGVFVSGGTLLVNGSLPAGNVVTATSGTLGGSGAINCPVTVQSGATLQPGAGGATVGLLNINSTLSLGGTTAMYVNKTGATNSQVAGLSTVIYGGTLNVANLGGTFVAGDKFTLFNAASHLGSFSAVNLPALPGGLNWSNSLAIDGSIQVVNGVNTNPTNITATVSGSTLSLSWPADHTGWRLLVQTNHLVGGISTVSTDWMTVPGSTTINQTNITINPALPTEFYRLVYP
jgi:autotransporter-associated beta strand protein